MTLPLRAGVGWTRFVLRAGIDVAGCAVKAGGKLVGAAAHAAGGAGAATADRPGDRFDAPAGEPAVVREPAPASPSDLTPDVDQAPPAVPQPPAFAVNAEPARTFDEAAETTGGFDEAAETTGGFDEQAERADEFEEAAEPAHVSEEPELVSEVAEPGAEDGAGPSIRIAEPWPGYDQMQAKHVISRLAAATPAELAAIQLYESSNRDRQTVRAAVQRSLKTKTGRGSPDREE